MFGLAPGIDGSELIIVLVVALIVVGPKDLPGLIRRIGAFMGKMRGMAQDFRASFDEMARQSELDDLRREVQALKSGQPFMEPLTAPAKDAFADIRSELEKPATSARPFAPAEPAALSPEPVGEWTYDTADHRPEITVVGPPRKDDARPPMAPRPFAPLAEPEPVAAAPEPQAARAARPFAPASELERREA